MTTKSNLFLFHEAKQRDTAVEAWFGRGDLHRFARLWFDAMRACGSDVRELLHDGMPTACVGDAAFGYVNAFKAHVNVGFFQGAFLDDPQRLLEGSGKRMRHVKLHWGAAVDESALQALIKTAYRDMQARLLSGT